jgi:acetyl esterase/lipase
VFLMFLSFLIVLGVLIPSRVVRDLAYGPFSRQRLDVHAPVGADGEEPVVVFLQGPERRLCMTGQILAARGFVVVVPALDPYPPRAAEDAAAACAWAEAHAAAHGGDPSRLFIFGHGEGAAVAAALALDPGRLGRAGVQTPLRGAVAVCGAYDGEDFALTDQARSDAPPLLLAAGRDERDEAGRHASSLARALRAVGGQVTEIRDPGLEAKGTLSGLLGLAPHCPRLSMVEIERFIRLRSLSSSVA